MGMATGPAAPMMTDQKRAGRSRAAQRQYLRGVDQKRGAADDMMGDILAAGERGLAGEGVEGAGAGAAYSIGGRDVVGILPWC